MTRILDDEPCPCGSGGLFKECHRQNIDARRPKITSHVALAVIPEPDPNSRSVFEKGGEGTLLIEGRETSISYDCGGCSAPLAVGILVSQIPGIVMRCARCGAYNEGSGPLEDH